VLVIETDIFVKWSKHIYVIAITFMQYNISMCISADLIIEAMHHTMSGLAAATPSSGLGPRETSILEDIRPKTNLLIFPHAKSNNFKLTMLTPTPGISGPSPAPSFKSTTTTSPRSQVGMRRSMSSAHVPSPIFEEEIAPSFQKSRSLRSKSGMKTPQEYIRVRPFPDDDTETIVPPVFRNTNIQTNMSPANNMVSTIGDPDSNVIPNGEVEEMELDSTLTSLRNQNNSVLSKFQCKTPTLGLSTFMTPEPHVAHGNNHLLSTDTGSNKKTRVTVPKSVKPFIITPEIERIVNMKSRQSVLSQTIDTNEGGSESQDLTTPQMEPFHANKNVVKTDQEEQTNTQIRENTLFKTFEPREGRRSRMADDIFVMSTPSDPFNSGRSTANDVSLPEIPSPNTGMLLGEPQMTSSPKEVAPKLKTTVIDTKEIYQSPIKAQADETERLYNMDVDLM